MSVAGEKVVDTAEDVAEDVGHAYGAWFKSYMKIFGRRALEWFLVYMFGYYNVSFGWLMAPLFFLVLRDKRAKEKKVKFDIIRSIANADEKDIIQEIQRFSNLPSWVSCQPRLGPPTQPFFAALSTPDILVCSRVFSRRFVTSGADHCHQRQSLTKKMMIAIVKIILTRYLYIAPHTPLRL